MDGRLAELKKQRKKRQKVKVATAGLKGKVMDELVITSAAADGRQVIQLTDFRSLGYPK
jgi:hypothetical protein